MSKISYINDLNEWLSDFHFYTKVKVRFSETDLFGHMNNTVPFAYFEEARIEFFKSLGIFADWINQETETIPVVANLQCDFLSQVYFDEKLFIYVKIKKIGTTSIDLHYMAQKENEQLAFVGQGTMVNMSKHTGKGCPWSDQMRQCLEESRSAKV